MDKYILKKRKVISKDQCEILSNNRNFSLDSKHNYYVYHANLSQYPFLGPILLSALKEYGDKHKFLNPEYNKNSYYTSWGIDGFFNIQKYLPGQFYAQGEHCERGTSNYDYRRILAWMIYLNDIKYKGGTCFPQQNFTTKPRVGDLYIWPAGWTHSHYGIAAPKEIKYMITGWCSSSI
tara:strand:- start:689 stop:1222 length:534 start_codon:yes stop_codon:yes gene_type:complete